ncbi:3'-phosphate, 5'-polynucleotide kinase [Caulobacter phage C1]|nr:3'-phosphate, 5'-polynucleotide kinase [Caulobacter phage C1]UTU08401.1 3'-phosphate, 5'-polynucleotide kinase [Caulobacter phage C2]UTU08918.1 3'-phosphate, 5'-polynucleotide kinase [Caulobacter phage J4]UTU09474.1 3'-phosphate, 5'-polynucleotide kinase [Caulobacter phage BL47]UTU10034.1 3'-phosphate, 5'-polynucleotide kinase [Caulobacter phage RB23]WGN97069.1 3'-phosphate, 5'-polynucleotide kinase [Bertelyvirus sp.]
MGFYIFDFDGTLAQIDHRRHLVEDGRRDWNAFFEACDQDAPIQEVIDILNILAKAGHRVEIWSGRSAAVEQKSRDWLARKGVDPIHLKRMRPIDDFQPDDKLKLSWLNEERSLGHTPDVIFDDRQKVVDMWRANDVPCFQVNPGDFDAPKQVRPYGLYDEGGVPLLTVLIGPAGAGKTSFALSAFEPQSVTSTDTLRLLLAGSPEAQDRNAAVFRALEMVVQARLLAGLPTVVDATNVRRADRVALVKAAPRGVKVAYVVIHRPVEEIEATAGDRLKVLKKHGKEEINLVRKHEEVFRSNLKDIKNGDGFANVEVFMTGEDYLKAVADRSAAYAASLALSAVQMVMGVSQGV